MKYLLDSFILHDVTMNVSLQCIANRKKRKIKIPDNIIISTAQVHRLALVTRNVGDFASLDTEILDIFQKIGEG